MSAAHDFSSRYPAYQPATSHFANMADPSQQQQQQQQQQRQPSYPSPHNSYPSPQMPTYTYPPPQGQSPAEPYRSPPQGTALHLPPIRIDGTQQNPQQQQQQQPGQPMGSPLPPPQHAMPQYYAHPAHQPGQQMNMGPQHLSNMSMRYQLPPQSEQRILSGGRHKKEIKRRTKTGCLTCRKRRIKCDEAHPVCRNCQKSKRECLGYDPIFKQQSGPSQIQPAPNSTPHQAPVPAPAPATTAPYAAAVPQGYAPASSAGYPPPPPPSNAAHHPQHDNFNTSAIDPALAATDPTMHSQQQYNGVHALNPALRGNSYPPAVPEGPVKGRRMDISELFKIANHTPPDVPSRPGPIAPELDDEFSTIFKNDYCVGLDVMLETTWYSTNNNALNKVFADKSLHEEAVFFAETVKYRSSANDMSGVFGQEARLLWHLLATCKHASTPSTGANGTSHVKVEHDDILTKEASARFEILEALLTNQTLSANPIRHIVYPPDLPQMETAKLEFWDQLGEFVVIADTDSQAAEYALGRMRHVLHAQEIRDAIYSIAIARQVGNRVRGFPNALPAPVDQDPDNDLNKLNVAMSFISHECRSGSQQVIARVCDMALLSWTVSRVS